MGVYTKEEQIKLIKENPFKLKFIENQYEDICLEAVKREGCALRYVKEQTEDICIEAVKRDEKALEFVKEQTTKICLAVINNDEFLEEVENDNKTPVLCFYAFLQKYQLSNINKYIKNGLEIFISTKNSIENNIFCTNRYKYSIPKYIKEDFIYFDINSFLYLRDFLIKENNNNTYIFHDDDFRIKSKESLNLLKEIALSNNKLILVDTGNIKDIHKKLANRIIKEEDLYKESF